MKRSRWIRTCGFVCGASAVISFGLPTARAATPGATYAVVVGVDDYVRDTITPLRYAVADAKVYAQALHDVQKADAKNIFLYTSDSPDENTQPKLGNIVYCLDEIKKKATAFDTIIFYFAGHGLTMEGDSFLLTQEADNRSSSTLRLSSLRDSELSDMLAHNPAGRTLAILDACRSDLDAGAPADALDGTFTQQIAPLGNSSQIAATLFSCRVGERSWEWDERKHGFFTYQLVQGLGKAGADPTGAVTLKTLQDYLDTSVPDATKKFAPAPQTPSLVFGKRSIQDYFALVRYDATGQAAAAEVSTSELALMEARQNQIYIASARQQAALERSRATAGSAKELEARLDILQKACSGTTNDATVAQLQAKVADLTAQTTAAQATLKQAQDRLAAVTPQAGRIEADAPSGQEVAMVILTQAEARSLSVENQELSADADLTRAKLQASNLKASTGARDTFVMDNETSTKISEAHTNADALESRAHQLQAADPASSSDAMSQTTAQALVAAAEGRRRQYLLERKGIEEKVGGLESSYDGALKQAMEQNKALAEENQKLKESLTRQTADTDLAAVKYERDEAVVKKESASVHLNRLRATLDRLQVTTPEGKKSLEAAKEELSQALAASASSEAEFRRVNEQKNKLEDRIKHHTYGGTNSVNVWSRGRWEDLFQVEPAAREAEHF